MKYPLNLSSLRTGIMLILTALLILLTLPGLSPAEHKLPGMAPDPGEYPDVRGIPCGSWMAHFTLTEKCEKLEAFFNKYEPLADQGNPAAQTLIGLKYFQYPQTKGKAAAWIQKAADQGFGPAQYELALLYENGNGGVTKDVVQAYKWYGLALGNGEVKAEARLKELEGGMSPEALAEARKLSAEWQPTPFKQACPEVQPKNSP